MASKRIDVVYDKRYGKWTGHTYGISHTSEIIGDTKKGVVRKAKNVVKRYEAKLKIENKNGTLQRSHDYRSSSGNSSGGNGGGLFDGLL